MEIIRPGMFFGLIALPLLTSSAISQPGAISWPDAIAQLAGEHVKAKTCVALLKRYGDYAQVARGEITYNKAKADSDAVIAGLITALSTKKTSASLPSLQDKLSSGASGLAEFCNTVDNLLPKP